jgi:hypothetical protein
MPAKVALHGIQCCCIFAVLPGSRLSAENKSAGVHHHMIRTSYAGVIASTLSSPPGAANGARLQKNLRTQKSKKTEKALLVGMRE